MSTILKPVKSRSLSDDVFESLREAIFSGRLRPGDPLRELHLAKELSVSQHTVRDARVKLERYGLVVKPRRPTSISTATSGANPVTPRSTRCSTNLSTPLFAFVSILRSVSGEEMKNLENSHEELLDGLKSKKATVIKQAVSGHFIGSYDIFLNSGAESLEEMIARRAG